MSDNLISQVNKLKETLDRVGFIEIDTTENEFASIALSLGSAVASRKDSGMVDILMPKNQDNSHPNSLSKIHGTGRFPFHTDGAYFKQPPKYIALRYAGNIKFPTPTEILDIVRNLSEADELLLNREMWSVRGRATNFYSSVFEKKLPSFIRYDRGCMIPVHQKSYMDIVIRRIMDKRKFVNWYNGRTLLLNNWQMLHARPQVKDEEIGCRILQRIMINE